MRWTDLRRPNDNTASNGWRYDDDHDHFMVVNTYSFVMSVFQLKLNVSYFTREKLTLSSSL